MNSNSIRILLLSLTCTAAVHSAQAASIKTSTAKVSMPAEKTSLIEKALNQQKKGDNNLQADNDLKMMTTIKTAPTQSFLASQNQRFTRFVQSIFSQNNS